MFMLKATRVASPTLPSQLGSPPLTLLLMPPDDLRSPNALRVGKMFPADLPEEFLQAGGLPMEDPNSYHKQHLADQSSPSHTPHGQDAS